MTVTVDLLNANGTLHTAGLSDIRERGWVHPRARMGLGMGTLMVPLDADLYDDLAPHRLLRWNLDGSPVWLSVVAAKPQDRVADSHDGRVSIVDGPGGLALLGTSDVAGAVVEGFRDSGLVVFGWPAPDFDDSSWSASIAWQTSATQRPGDMWPDQGADKIQMEAPVGGDNDPQETWFHRREVTVAAGTDVRVFVWWDNLGTFWLDGEQVAKGSGLLSFERYDFEAAGDHLLAFSLFNKAKSPDSSSNPSSLMYAGFEVGSDGELGDLLFRSVAGAGVWSDAPAEVSAGYVWGRLLQDAQGRGCVPGVTWTFTDDLDSDGQAWSTTLPMVSFRDGEHYWGVLRQCLHLFGGIDAEMAPDLELKLWDDRVSASGVTLDDPGTVNVLTNGSFETGDLTGWTTSTTGSATATVVADAAATDGGFVVELDAVTADDVRIRSGGAASEGEVWTASFDVVSHSGPDPATVTMWALDSGGGFVAQVAARQVSTVGRHSVTSSALPANTATVSLLLRVLAGNEATVRFDAAELGLADPGVDAAVAGAQSEVVASGANAVRFEAPDSFGWRVDAGRVSAEGRRETSAAFGTATSDAEVTAALDELAADLRGKVRQQIVSYGPAGKRPYTDYGVASEVSVNHDGTATTHVVESLSVTVDDDNDEVTFDVDVEAPL